MSVLNLQHLGEISMFAVTRNGSDYRVLPDNPDDHGLTDLELEDFRDWLCITNRIQPEPNGVEDPEAILDKEFCFDCGSVVLEGETCSCFRRKSEKHLYAPLSF